MATKELIQWLNTKQRKAFKALMSSNNVRKTLLEAARIKDVKSSDGMAKVRKTIANELDFKTNSVINATLVNDTLEIECDGETITIITEDLDYIVIVAIANMFSEINWYMSDEQKECVEKQHKVRKERKVEIEVQDISPKDNYFST